MKKDLCSSFGFIFIAALMIIGITAAARAEINVNINTGPPPIAVSAPSVVVMMPQSGIYFVPGISFDVFFYNGYWWSPRGDRWYRASRYKGPWEISTNNNVPDVLFKVPKNYREVYKKERRVNYTQWDYQLRRDKSKINQLRINKAQVKQDKLEKSQDKQNCINQKSINKEQIKQDKVNQDQVNQSRGGINMNMTEKGKK